MSYGYAQPGMQQGMYQQGGMQQGGMQQGGMHQGGMQQGGMHPGMGYNQQGMGMAQPMGVAPAHAGYNSAIHGALANENPFPTKKVPTTITTPQNVTCSSCSAKVSTSISSGINTSGWLLCLLLLCCFPPYCFVVFFCDSLKDHVHSCPNCKADLSYKM